jgi:hypothetical protein
MSRTTRDVRYACLHARKIRHRAAKIAEARAVDQYREYAREYGIFPRNRVTARAGTGIPDDWFDFEVSAADELDYRNSGFQEPWQRDRAGARCLRPRPSCPLPRWLYLRLFGDQDERVRLLAKLSARLAPRISDDEGAPIGRDLGRRLEEMASIGASASCPREREPS